MKLVRASFLVSACLAGSAVDLRSQSVAVFEGPPAGPGRVRVLDPQKAAAPVLPAGLQGIRLLPIDFVGRTRLFRLLPDRPRLAEDVPTGRIVLQGGRGSLYRFARDEGAAGSVFGYFLVEPSGVARVVHERPGAGPMLADDPFVARIAVAPDGGTLLVATRVAAGGDLLEIDVATGEVFLRTPGAAAFDFSDAGLALHAIWGVGVHAGGVLRFDRASREAAAAVPFPAPAPGFFSGELVLSSNGAFAATTAGTGADLLHAFVFAPAGAAVRASAIPERLSGAGFLPEAPDGPHLAVSDDGTRCAWRREGVTQEAFIAEIMAPGPLHITSDLNYLDTLDAVGQFIFIDTLLMLAVGEQSALGVHQLDVYGIELEAGTSGFTNISLSSGDPDVPFLSPSTIDPEGSSTWNPATGEILLADRGQNQLIAIREGQVGVRVLASDVRDLDFVEPLGDELVIAIRRESGTKPRQITRLPADLASGPVLLYSDDDADAFVRPAARPGAFAFIEDFELFERARRIDLATGAVELLTTRPFFYGPSQTFAAGGELVLSVGAAPANAIFLAWPVGKSVLRLASPGQPGFVLPGV
jgi:hypothetical protein